MICSAGARSPSENSEVAVTTSGGRAFSVATWAAAVAAFSRIAGEPIEALQHAPAHRQRRIDVDRPQQRLDRRRRVLQRDVAEAALLVQAAEPRLQRLAAVRASPGLGDAQQVAQADRRDQQQVAVLRAVARAAPRAPAAPPRAARPSAAPRSRRDFAFDRGERGASDGMAQNPWNVTIVDATRSSTRPALYAG